jgi:MerR family transcriptional regulator, light-induced transcriptional regulator
MSRSSGHAEYSIAAVSKLAGVSCHALRVWERRYGFPIPERSASGHRRYANEQVNVLRSLAKMASSGQSIGELIGDYQAGKLELRAVNEAKVDEKTPASQVVDRLFKGDLASADAILDRLSGEYAPVELLERVIEPALIEIGERWYRGECDVYQEHFATTRLFARIGSLLDRTRRENHHPSHSVIVGTIQGDRHEGGVLMVSLVMELAGWRAIAVGTDLPVEEYLKMIETWQPDALGLSFVLSRNINKRFQELSQIRDVPIFVGGRSIVNHQGLARRHGLIPLTGSLSSSSAQLLTEFELWKRLKSRGIAARK